jgi:hypothetical protein
MVAFFKRWGRGLNLVLFEKKSNFSKNVYFFLNFSKKNIFLKWTMSRRGSCSGGRGGAVFIHTHSHTHTLGAMRARDIIAFG